MKRIDVLEQKRTAWLAGPHWIVVDACKRARVPRMWDPNRRAWGVPVGRLDDVLAAIELGNGGDVQVRSVVVL